MLKKYHDILNSNPLFSTLTEEEQRQLLNHYSSITTHKKNSIVYLEKTKCRSLDLVLKGKLVVQDINKNGNVVLLKHISQGETFGANLLFADNSYYPMTFLAKNNSAILHVDKANILRLCQNKLFLQAFLALVSEQALFLATRIKSFTHKSLRELIIVFLQHEYHSQRSQVIKLSTTKKELAERFGVQRSSLSRELQKMRKEGLITYDAKTITILNLRLNAEN